MPTEDQSRIFADRARPRVMELWWALAPLRSVIRFMNTGAHPDDETSAMLASLAFRDGINLSYACSTRGEGGQNDIGTEAGSEIGALRTREMERACDVLGMRLYWHGESPDDTVTDFGFSKSGEETLGKWGHQRTLARFVEIVRTDRPDIICPTFLDVPGQHGHHRAMTQAAHEVMAAAADPEFASNLPPWQVKKLYLPAWSGAGQSYDDDLPPPPATLTIDGSGFDPVSGWDWERIGQQSRAYHQTQNMGRWVPKGRHRDWPLHMVESHVAGPDRTLASGLPATVAALAELSGAEPIAEHLRAAGAAIDAAVACYPAYEPVARNAAEALGHIRAALGDCPEALSEEIAHRLRDKEVQLGHVLRIALGVEARAGTGAVWLGAGSSAPWLQELDPGMAESAAIVPDLPRGWRVENDRLALGPEASASDPYRSVYDPADPPAPAIRVETKYAGLRSVSRIALDPAPVVLPKPQVQILPRKAVVNLAVGDGPIRVSVGPMAADGAFVLPEGWRAVSEPSVVAITPPNGVAPGLYHLPYQVGGAPAHVVRRISHPHVAPTFMSRQAQLDLRVMDVALPPSRVGYVGGGNDRVAHWLAAIGLEVTDLSATDLEAGGLLDGFDAIVIGIFALRFRPGLAEAMPRLHAWCEGGGTLVTLYHRPWDNWSNEHSAPRFLEIGQPSLRWRVCDETAAVTHLAEHPVLTTPNHIGPEDWEGWVKERGLYFAKSWDPAYVQLLEMADPDEAPHRGALLVADIGKGRHVHTSLVLHHQMENLVPGAFRLMANLVARRE